MNESFTVAIPTYNPGKRIDRLVENLLNQQGIEGERWEILIVDNNSTDGSDVLIAELIESYQSLETPKIRSVIETNQGAAYARIRAVKEISSDYIAFVDDDIYPDPNWIRNGLNAIKEDPKAAVIAGKTLLSEDIKTFEGFEEVARMFAIEEPGESTFNYSPRKMHMPPSAAVWVRREAWVECVDETPILRGSSRDFPFSGDDYEAFLRIALGGWLLKYDPSLVTRHELDPERFKRPKMKRLSQIIGYATYPTRMLDSEMEPRPIWMGIKMIPRGILMYIGHCRKYGWSNKSTAGYMKKHHSIAYSLSPLIYLLFRIRGKM